MTESRPNMDQPAPIYENQCFRLLDLQSEHRKILIQQGIAQRAITLLGEQYEGTNVARERNGLAPQEYQVPDLSDKTMMVFAALEHVSDVANTVHEMLTVRFAGLTGDPGQESYKKTKITNPAIHVAMTKDGVPRAVNGFSEADAWIMQGVINELQQEQATQLPDLYTDLSDIVCRSTPVDTFIHDLLSDT